MNPIRAGISETPETSDFTSVKERIEDRAAAAEVSTADARDVRIEQGDKAGWLAPISLEPPRKEVREKATTRRASNKGCQSMTLDQYLKFLDWTGRQIRKDKTGQLPDEFAPILEPLECNAETGLDFVRNFRKRFRNEVESGKPESAIHEWHSHRYFSCRGANGKPESAIHLMSTMAVAACSWDGFVLL